MKRRLTVSIAAILLLVGLPIVGMFAWISSRPAWRLSARNTAGGVVVDIYKEHQIEPTYSTVLEGHSIPRDVDRAARQDLPAEIGNTTFSDETIRPGRWTLVLDGVTLDIMERVLVIDGNTEIAPNE